MQNIKDREEVMDQVSGRYQISIAVCFAEYGGGTGRPVWQDFQQTDCCRSYDWDCSSDTGIPDVGRVLFS